jgi:MFS family permease
MTLSLLVIGPSWIFHFPKKVWITIIGFGIIGAGAASSVVPIIPEMLDAVEGKYSDEAQVKDIAASIFNMANGVGQIFGPLLAGGLYGYFKNEEFPYPDPIWIEAEIDSFAITCDIFAGIVFTYAVIYFLVCDGVQGVRDSVRNTCRGGKKAKTGHTLLEDEKGSFEDTLDDEKQKINKSKN